MPKSMTGYGRAQQMIAERDVLVEIRSVNHRYYEFSARLPRTYLYLEEKLKTLLNGSIVRGKVEVSVTINRLDGKDAQVIVNESVANGYIDALRSYADRQGGTLRDDLTLSSLLRLQDVFTVTKATEDETEVWAAVSVVAQQALDAFINMRAVEGARLAADLTEKLSNIEQMLASVEAIVPTIAEQYRNRLYAKLSELLQAANIDDQRILTETAIFAEKTAVDEEMVRLHSHLAQASALLTAEEPIGRKLDFLVQEMNREVNTIGSKAQDLQVTKLVVDMKSEIEKIREQIQNIE